MTEQTWHLTLTPAERLLVDAETLSGRRFWGSGYWSVAIPLAQGYIEVSIDVGGFTYRRQDGNEPLTRDGALYLLTKEAMK